MFENKIIAITGGTDGIGKALVKEFLNKGAKVATCSRTQDKLDQFKNRICRKTFVYYGCRCKQRRRLQKFY